MNSESIDTIKSNSSKNFSGLFFLILATFVMGAIIGVGVYLVSKIIYLILIFPFFMGIAGGSILGSYIKRYKISQPWIGIVFGLIIGCVIYGTYHYAGYIGFQVELDRLLEQQLIEQQGQADRETIDLLVDYFIFQESGYQGFVGYMVIMANEGISIGHLFSGSFLTLPPWLTYLYWMIELVLIVSMCINIPKKAADQPMCEYCGNWLNPLDHIGSADISRTDEIVELIKKGDYFNLGKLLQDDAPVPSVDLHLQDCSGCDARPVDLIIKQAQEDIQGKVSFEEHHRSIISAAQKKGLLRGVPNQEK